MIITRAPFRISLFGGSSDYSSFYNRFGSLLVGFTIDKYVYVSMRQNYNLFDYKSRITYSIIENVKDNKQIQNPGIRGALEYFDLQDPVTISVQSDLPKQTGIGSSSALSVALCKAIDVYKNNKETFSNLDIAKQAIHIERVLLGEPGGIQDQIWSAMGGVNSITLDTSGLIKIRPLPVSPDFLNEFRGRCVLCHTGFSRQSFELAASHDSESNVSIKQNILQLAHEGLEAFHMEDIYKIGRLLHKSWQLKRSIATGISNDNIDTIYKNAINKGAIGGKLLGSGSNGFMLFVLEEGIDRGEFVKSIKLEGIDYNYSYGGAEVLLK